MEKKALILVNIGTPKAPELKEVRKYLSEFLNDRRVIDIPWIFRKILVNLIIVPFRAPKSTILYQKLWTDKGSPLQFHLDALVALLKQNSDANTDVFGAMRYGENKLSTLLKTLKQEGYEHLTVLPLFPQYASSTTGSINEVVVQGLSRWKKLPKLDLIKQFYNHPAFIDAFIRRIDASNYRSFDHVIFSYHGLPLRQIRKSHPKKKVCDGRCETEEIEWGEYCYKGTCYETTRLLVKRLGLSTKDYSVAFQSRLSKNWLTPFTDKTILDLAGKGCKRLLIVAPAFVADCLETTVEIGEEYKELFLSNGGEHFEMVESLNSSPAWADAIWDIAKMRAPKQNEPV